MEDGNCKVTIRPEFFGTVPNFDRLSRKKFEVIRDAELSRICPDLTSGCVAVQAVDQNAVDIFDVFDRQRCDLLSSKRTKSIFCRGLPRTPMGELRILPHTPIDPHSRTARG